MPVLRRVYIVQPVTPHMRAVSLIGHATYYTAGRKIMEGDLWHHS